MRLRFALFCLASAGLLCAIDAGRDFSGKWILSSSSSRISVPGEETLTIDQQPTEIRCSAGGAQWTYALNGTERKAQIDAELRNSVVKWEGAALLIDTIITGPQDYTVMDRWSLSPDDATLTVTRQVVRGTNQEEATFRYLRAGQTPAPPPPLPAPLARREQPAAISEVTIPAGTHIPLTFRNTVDTKHSQAGERIYLQTEFPVAQDGRVVIPRGSFVTGVITQIKPPGHLGSKGELFIRFDTLTLPNGVTRDFRSRLGTDDEGKVSGEPNRSADTRKVTQAAGTGAGVGVATGSAAGHAGMGAGIGGAAAGIASVLLSRGTDARLPEGTTVDMVLDRDLRFRSDELLPRE